MKVLFIDEDGGSITPALNKAKDGGLICEHIGFGDHLRYISEYQPDIIILDLMNGHIEDPKGNAGKQSYTDIWRYRFCPVIFYSANPDLIDEKTEHPFVSKIQKGRDSEDLLYEKISSFKEQIESIIETKKSIDMTIQNALRDLAPLIFNPAGFSDMQNKSLQYLSRRRVAALMDDAITSGQSIPSWGIYIWPPLNNYPKLGDVLFKTGENPLPLNLLN